MGVGLKQKAQKALALKERYTRAYETDFDEGRKLELEYLELRKEILAEVDNSTQRQRAVPVRVIKERVAARPKKPKRETGIRSLDRELVTEKQHKYMEIGGFPLGNYIQIAGSRGAGKTSFLLKILTNLSKYEPVVWFDFEMGEQKVADKLCDFDHDDENLLYYAASRDLEEIVKEIKLHNAMGASHYVIDSTMKLNVKGAESEYEKFTTISSTLSELTSTLGINIYIINQLSQQSERDGNLMLKGGNNAEYDADYILFILKMKKVDNGKVVKDEMGFDVYDDDARLIYCTKNRPDDRTFKVKIDKSEIFCKPEVIEYEELA